MERGPTDRQRGVLDLLKGGAVITYESICGRLGYYVVAKIKERSASGTRINGVLMSALIEREYVEQISGPANQWVLEVWGITDAGRQA